MSIAKIQDVKPGTKDAFHVQCVLVWSEDYLTPGTYVKFVDNNLLRVKECCKSERHGIVDPFMNFFKLGDKFWVLLQPGLTKSLRHNFDLELEEFDDDSGDTVSLGYDDEDEDNEKAFEEFDDDGCRGCNS